VPDSLAAPPCAANERGGAPAVRAEGIRAAITLCEELIEANAPGLHFYTLNRSTPTSEIYHALFSRFRDHDEGVAQKRAPAYSP
jgi:hypothetical protein